MINTFKKNRSVAAVIMAVILMISVNHSAVAQSTSPDWIPLEKAVETASHEHKPILIDVWAPWCGWCKKMEKEVYPELSEKLNEQFVLTRLNRDDNRSKISYQNVTYTPLRLAQKLQIGSVPAMVVLSPQGEYLFHISGFIEKEKLAAFLDELTPAELHL